MSHNVKFTNIRLHDEFTKQDWKEIKEFELKGYLKQTAYRKIRMNYSKKAGIIKRRYKRLKN